MHPARTIPFADLYAGLEAAREAKFVVRKDCPATGRAIYVYSQSCVYDNGWNAYTLLARGLILHPERQEVIATPFPKFFNAGERGAPIPDLPFEVFEKVDGSLIILHYFDGEWRTATKGTFDSAQAKWAAQYISQFDLSPLDQGTTYLAEAVFPENRIVVHYSKAELVMLAAYGADGLELTFEQVESVAGMVGWRTAKRYNFPTFTALMVAAEALPATEEGYVIRFVDGLRLKLKGEEYKRIHALISRCTPLAMWEAMRAGDDMSAVRRDLPEEFWTDFDSITSTLAAKVDEITAKVVATAAEFADKTDKDVGLSLPTIDPDVRPLIFHYRKQGGQLTGKARDSLFRLIRPTGNMLPGYTPSYAMGRVLDEAL